jgi:hypothetical protein
VFVSAPPEPLAASQARLPRSNAARLVIERERYTAHRVANLSPEQRAELVRVDGWLEEGEARRG